MLPLIRNAARRAAAVFNDTGAKSRIEQDGYTRVDPFLIAGSVSVPVLLRPLDKLLGAFIRDEISGILVNSERSAGLVHMTCAHELGHYFMGHDNKADESVDYGPQADRQEQEADWFAYHLLAPRVLLANVMRRKGWSIQSVRNPLVLYQLSLRLGISYTAAAWSLSRHNLIDQTDVRQLLKVQPAEIKSALLGAQAFNYRKEVWLLDESDRASVLEPRADDRILVRLKSHAAAGYLWSLDQLATEGFHIQPIVPQSEEVLDTSRPVFGGSSTAQFLLTYDEMEEVGNGNLLTLAMQELRPWINDAQANATFETKAQFEQVEPGLTRVAKQQLLHEALAT